MEIFPIAYDSFGVRSMATFVKINELKIFIDPGVALGPSRYGLSPTKEEFLALEICRKKIIEIAEKCDIILVSHYHYDHHPFPDDLEMYERCFKEKIVIAKDITKNINFSGRNRGKIFEDRIKNLVKSLEWGDGKKFEFEKVKIEVSEAVWHGEVGSKVGKVVMFYLEKGKDSFLFGSDAQSLADPAALKWVLEKNPKFMILDGYPTIFVGWQMSKKSFQLATQNLKKVIEKTQAKTIILEHHILRDLHYKEKLKEIFELAKNLNKKIFTVAEFYGQENLFLEAWRKDLYERKIKVDVESYFKKVYKKIEI
jgi:predicted metallo-beta-lactamase superfamily hydrolase